MDFYARNGFRFLGLPAWAEPNTVAARWQQYRSLMHMNAARARGASMGTMSDGHLDAEAVLASVARLESPRHRFLAELFWVHVADADFQKLRQEGALASPQALAMLSPDSQPGLARVKRLHALAVASHCLAIEKDLDYLERRAPAPAGQWEAAIKCWRDLCNAEEFWAYMQTRVEKLDDPRLQKEDVAKARAELPAVILAFHETLAEKYAASGQFPDCVRHLRLISQSGFPEAVVRAATWSAVKKVAGTKLEDLEHRARETFRALTARVDRAKFESLAGPLLLEAREIHALLSRQLELADEYLAQSAFDHIAELVHDATNAKILYEGEGRERNILYSSLLNKRILALPLSSVARRKIEASIQDDRRVLYSRFGLDAAAWPDPTKCFFAEGAEADPDESLLQPLHKITNREVTMDHARGSAGVRVSYESVKVLIPRSKVAKTAKRGTKAEVPVPEAEYTPRQRAVVAELRAAEGDASAAVAALERARDAAVAEEERRRDSELQAHRLPSQARRAEAEAAIAQDRLSEQSEIAAENQRWSAERAQIQAAQAPLIEAARTSETRTRGNLTGFKGFVRLSLPLCGLCSLALWQLAPDLDWFAAFLGSAAGLVLGKILRAVLEGRRSRKLLAAELAGDKACGKSEKASQAKKKEIQQAHARQRKPWEDVVAGIAQEEKAIRDRFQQRIDSLRSDCDRKKKDASANFEERARKLRSELVRLVVVKDLSSQAQFPPCQAARSQGFSDGKEPSQWEMQMTEAERTQAQMMLLLRGMGR